MMKINLYSWLVLCLMAVVGCSSTDTEVQKALEKNPELVINVIKKHPHKFIESLRVAEEVHFKKMKKEHEEERAAKIEEDFKNPKNPIIRSDSPIRGNKNAPITIVEYASFNCGYCADGAASMNVLRKIYGDRVQVVFKHMAQDPVAIRIAQMYEAIALQSQSKAMKFHDLVYENLGALESNAMQLRTVAQQAGADLKRLETDQNREEINAIIESDTNEAVGFGFLGTPVYVVNGVRMSDTTALEDFQKIINRHLKKMGLPTVEKLPLIPADGAATRQENPITGNQRSSIDG